MSFNKSLSMLLKRLLILALIVCVASCKSKTLKESDTSIKENKEESVIDQTPETYQTINNEQQAEDVNKQTQAQVEEIEVQDRIFFGYDSSEVNSEAQKILNTQAEWLKSDPTIKVTIEGHCDERGTREYNIALGEKRAVAVKKYLITQGVEASRIKTVSYGKERPAFFGNKDDSLSKNRRAVTVVN